MSRPATLVLALALGLGAVLAMEWALPPPRRAAPVPPRLPRLASGGPGRRAPGDGAAPAVILAHPLFTPGRRPPAHPAPAPPQGWPRLAGVLVSPAGRLAIFALPGAAPPVIAPVGGLVGGRIVLAIAPDQAILSGPAGPVVLHPAFLGPPAAPPARPAAPRTVLAGVTPPVLPPSLLALPR